MEDCAVAPLKPRERIISTARDLFRKHGIRGIGVDAIADVAGTNKMTQRDRLARLCRDAGIAKADLLADTLSLLLEGARVSRQSAGVEGPCARFITIGEAVIAAFAHGTSGRKHSRSPRYAAGNAKVPRSSP